jgi:anti-sigma B factor antagonist
MRPDGPEKNEGENAKASLAVQALLHTVRNRVTEAPVAAADSPPPLVHGLWIPWDGLCVVALTGEMDIANASHLREALVAQVPSGPRYLVIELSQLRFVDSLGIHALTRLAKEARSNNGAVVVAGARGHVDRVLDIVKIDELLERTTSLEAALQHISVMAADDADGTTNPHWSTLADATRVDG